MSGQKQLGVRGKSERRVLVVARDASDSACVIATIVPTGTAMFRVSGSALSYHFDPALFNIGRNQDYGSGTIGVYMKEYHEGPDTVRQKTEQAVTTGLSCYNRFVDVHCYPGYGPITSYRSQGIQSGDAASACADLCDADSSCNAFVVGTGSTCCAADAGKCWLLTASSTTDTSSCSQPSGYDTYMHAGACGSGSVVYSWGHCQSKVQDACPDNAHAIPKEQCVSAVADYAESVFLTGMT